MDRLCFNLSREASWISQEVVTKIFGLPQPHCSLYKHHFSSSLRRAERELKMGDYKSLKVTFSVTHSLSSRMIDSLNLEHLQSEPNLKNCKDQFTIERVRNKLERMKTLDPFYFLVCLWTFRLLFSVNFFISIPPWYMVHFNISMNIYIYSSISS